MRGFADHGGDLVRDGHDVGEVDDEAGDGGDRDAASVGSVAGVDGCSVEARAGWGLAFARDKGIDKGGATTCDLEEFRSRPVADQGVRAAEEGDGHELGVAGERAEGVDASIDPPESPGLHALRDRAVVQPDPLQLRGR